MKANRIESGGRGKTVLAIVVSALVLAAIVGIALAYERLSEMCREQCIVTDMSAQVEIRSGSMVKPDVIAENLGIRKGANLAEIDFVQKRAEILEKIPTLRSISISRRLPDGVTIVAEERIPVARMSVKGRRSATGRVVDSEGMVFMRQRGTQLLPTIVEPQPPGTQPGHRIKGRTLAALRLVETCRKPEFAELGVQDVDVSRPDFLMATLGDYSRLKIAWDGMDEPSSKSLQDLEGRLTLLVKTIRSGVGTGAKTWNATLPECIFADTQENR